VECKFLAKRTEFLVLSLLQVFVILGTEVSGIGFPLSSTTLISSLFLPSFLHDAPSSIIASKKPYVRLVYEVNPFLQCILSVAGFPP
jgi:hypothetical protein